MNFRAFFINLLLLTMSYIGKSAYQQSLGENDYPVSYHSNKRVYFASKWFCCSQFANRSASTLLLKSYIRKCVLPRIPSLGSSTSVALPP